MKYKEGQRVIYQRDGMKLPKESTIIDVVDLISHKQYLVEDKTGIRDTVKESEVFGAHECPKTGLKKE
jgi:hypothetical protein